MRRRSSEKRPLHPAAASIMASFSAAALFGIMAGRPWFAVLSLFVALLAFFAWIDWP